MKKLNILVLVGLFITNTAHAGGVYGTFYDSSDLEVKKGQLTVEQLKKINEAKRAKEKERREQQEEAQRLIDQEFEAKVNKLKR